MINHLSIKDFAIIENISVDFQSGLNILTGETGSGKSIIIEAVSLALGSRADTAFVRSGRDRALIQLVVEDKNGEEMIITREILASGKSTCRINDELVTLSHLNAVCKSIADIHGQYDHQSLLNPDLHMELLDAYHASDIAPLKESVRNTFKHYAGVRQELASLLSNQAEAERKRDFMRFELNEIEAAKLSIGEDGDLAANLLLLQNSELIAGNLAAAYEHLYESELSTLVTLAKGRHLIGDLSRFSDDFGELGSALEDLYYKLEDTVADIRKQKDAVSYSPELIDESISRLDFITALKRKYGDSIEKILSYKEQLSADIEKIEHTGERREALQAEMQRASEELAALSAELSLQRKRAAQIVEKKIDQELSELNFSDASLTIRFAEPIIENGHPAFTENGIDKIEFLISTNKGEPAKPLVKIASGGEISRIMLAFKRIIGDFDEIPTMIFDEIDSGISGMTASIVGRKLSSIARRHQVICITHLPQIAAIGDHNYRILKKSDGDHTFTIIEPLDHQDKIKEVARLLAGMDITDHTLKNAEEMIDLSKQTL